METMADLKKMLSKAKANVVKAKNRVSQIKYAILLKESVPRFSDGFGTKCALPQDHIWTNAMPNIGKAKGEA